MDVVVTNTYNLDDGYESLEIVIDGNIKFHVHNSDSHEDNNLGRNFSDCHDIPELLRRAYLAGCRNEPFNVTHYEGEEEE